MSESKTCEKMIPRRKLGNTGIEVSAISLGDYGLGSDLNCNIYGALDDRMAIDLVHTSFRKGINFIDTNPCAGRSIKRLGLALNDINREDIILTGKVGTHPSTPGYDRNNTRMTVESLMKVFNTNYIDIVMIDEPNSVQLKKALGPGGALEELIEMKTAGIINHIGISCRDHDILKEFMDTGHCDVILTYNDYNLLNKAAQKSNLLSKAYEQNIGVINGGALYTGLLATQDPERLRYSGGARKGLRKYPCVSLMAQQMLTWTASIDETLLNLAIQFPFRQDISNVNIATCPIGFNKISEIDQVIDSFLGYDSVSTGEMKGIETKKESNFNNSKIVSQQTWDRFDGAFDTQLANIENDHYKWYKTGNFPSLDLIHSQI